MNNNNTGRDAAGNPNTIDPTGGGAAAQKTLDAAKSFAAARAAECNNSYRAPAEAFTQPGWTLDPATGKAVPPRR